MPRTPAKVTQADIARAIRAMRSAGIAQVRVRLDGTGAVVEADTPERRATGQADGPDTDLEVVEGEPLVLL